MWSALNSIGGLISRNKTKIALASVIAIAVTVYINYDSSDSEVEKQKTIKLLEEPSQSRPGTRSRLLLRIRTQFDFACRQFLPTLKTKVCEAVDINGTVSRIKKLRENSSSNTKEIESKLWNEIKTASFTILIVTAYAMSAVCTLLKLQLHLLARLIRQQGCEFQGTRIALNEIDFKLDDEMFHTLIQRTYQHFFERGLKEFIEQVKQQITVDLVGWNVKDKLHVSYDELIYAFKNIRINLERNIGPIVKTIFIRKFSIYFIQLTNSNATQLLLAPESIEQRKVSGEGCAIQHIIDQVITVADYVEIFDN